MANIFRSFLEKLGLVAPQGPIEAPISQPASPETQQKPVIEASIKAQAVEEAESQESASTEPIDCDSSQTDCHGDCCKQTAPHDEIVKE